MSSLQNIIAEADRGQLLADAETAIEEILTALDEQPDRSGELTVKIKFKTKNGAVQVLPEMAHKLSKPERLATVMFIGQGGELSRRDPRQPVMPIVEEVDFANTPAGRRHFQRED